MEDAPPESAQTPEVPPEAAEASLDADRGEVDEQRRKVVQWLWRVPVIAAAAGGGYGLYEAIRVHFRKFEVDEHPDFDARPETLIGSLAAFGEVWDSVTFEVPAGAPGEHPTPAVAVRLPGPIAGGIALDTGQNVASAYLAAFSRICTHQHCIVSLNQDLDAINLGFNYQTRSPALTCACHLSVFDPQQGGRAVSGPAVIPLPRVQLEARGNQLFATGIERSRA